VGAPACAPVCAVLREVSAPGQRDADGMGWKLACNAVHVLGQLSLRRFQWAEALEVIGGAMATARSELLAYEVMSAPLHPACPASSQRLFLCWLNQFCG
jgi:hypothetical protein